MKATSALLALLFLFGCEVETVEREAGEIKTKSAGGPSESLPMIDFPLLGEARPVDLIDMTLEFPESLKKLNGQRVGLIGFMAPFDSLEDMSRCQVVPSYVGCNFCSPPNLRQVVYVTQGSEDEPEKTYSFIEEPSYVTGTFKISLPESDHEGQTRGFVYSIENATVVPFEGEAPKRAPGHTNPASHNGGEGASSLSPVAPEELVREVCEIIGENSLLSVGIEPVSSEIFGLRIRGMLEATYPQETRLARAQAFSLLGMLPQNFDLIEALTGFELAQRVAVFDESKGQVLVLDSVPVDHPFVRLELVGAIADALLIKEKHNISGIPVVEDKEGKLVGILTNRDVRFADNLKQPVGELMTRNSNDKPLITVDEDTTRNEAKRLLHKHRIEKLLVVDDDFRCIGLITVKDIEKAQRYPNACKDELGRLRVAAATGVGTNGLERAEALIDAGADLVVVDTAHGHSKSVIDACWNLL